MYNLTRRLEALVLFFGHDTTRRLFYSVNNNNIKLGNTVLTPLIAIAPSIRCPETFLLTYVELTDEITRICEQL
jgi:hypothetical protein